jgi:methyltransferase family protein
VTHLSKLLVAELDAFRERTSREKLTILETGSIRGTEEQYHQNDGWSTLTFAEYVRDHGGSLTSIDLDTAAANEVLSRHEVRHLVDLIEGDSVETINALPRDTALDVVLLDSDNDADLIMREFIAVRELVISPALFLVDDVEPGSTGVVKGHTILPWLSNNGVPYRLERRTGTGYSTGVLVFEL